MTRALPPRPAEDESLARLVDPLTDLVQAALPAGVHVDSIRPDFRRDKGEDGTLAGFLVDLDGILGNCRRYMSLRWAPVSRLREEMQRFERHHEDGDSIAHPLPPFHLDSEAECLLLSFPFDRRLPRLPHLLTPRALVRMLESDEVERHQFAQGWRVRKRKSTWTLLSYRPERRVVVRWDVALRNDTTGADRDRSLVVRLHQEPPAQGAQIYRDLAAAGVDAPELVAAPDPDVRVESFCEGRPLSLAELPAAQVIERAGEMVGRWHASRPAAELPRTTREALVQQLEADRHCGATTEGMERELFDRGIAELRHETGAGPDPRPLHGDLHPGQILQRSSGVTLLDWDRASRGEPAQDLANLWVHLVAAGAQPGSPQLEALRRGYAASHLLPPDEDLRWHRLAAALRLLELPRRRPSIVTPLWSRRLLEEIHTLVSKRAGSRRTP